MPVNPGFQFENDVYCVGCNNLATALVAGTRYPASASFIDMTGIEHAVFLIHMGSFTTSTTWQVYQDTSATETGDIKVITGAAQAVVYSTNDNDWLTIEFDVEDMDLANSFRYVTIVSSAGTGADDFADVMFLGFGKKKTPVTQKSDYAFHVSV